jgi:transcriptional regulator with XRE-family HTH domain
VLQIKELRTDRRLSQEALAYKAGVSVRTVIRAEARHTASQRTLQLLASALGVSLDALFVEEVAS